MIKIAPSLLSADFADLKNELKTVETADFIHLDVMDGQFVPNLTFGAPVIKALKKHSELIFDVHLMIKDPIKYIDDFKNAGADIISFHIESDSNTEDTIKKIKSTGARCGLAVSPDTDIKDVIPYIDMIDTILVMSVYPGFGGQKFIENSLNKVSYIKNIIKDKNIDIEIDGGIGKGNIKKVADAGVDIAVAGTAVFGQEDRKKAIEELRV